MRDVDLISPPEVAPSRDSTIVLFLGLFLLVLAFFILLVSISTVEEVKSKAVMSSLTSTFQTVLPATLSPQVFQTLDGDIIANAALQDEVTNIFATSLQVARVEILQPGRLMRVHLQSRAVFEDESTEIRSSMMPLFNRVVAAISARPPGLRFDLEAVLSVATTDGTAMPVEQGLQMQRAGVFARTMLGRGLPPDSLAVGMSPSTNTDMVLWFYVRLTDEAREDLEGEQAAPLPQEPGTLPVIAPQAVPTENGGVGLTLPLPNAPTVLQPSNP